MPKHEDMHHSVLIVSASPQFDAVVKLSLTGIITIDSVKNASAARRRVLERYYDVILMNTPLPDESGEDLALDIAEKSNASVLLVVPQEVYANIPYRLIDHAICVIPKPSSRNTVDTAIRFLLASQNRIQQLERKTQALEEKNEELRVVSKAKILLVEQKHMTEDEAHRYIGKLAMDNGVSRRRVAERIIEDLGD